MRFSKELLLFCALATTSAHADLARMETQITLSATAGYPAPSYVGGIFAFQSHTALQWILGTGVFWSEQFQIQTLTGALRVHLLPSNLTPIIGAGLSAFFFHGRGDIQGLEASSMLGSLLVGLDFATTSRWRFAGGLQFHYPVRLMFPFVEFGLMF